MPLTDISLAEVGKSIQLVGAVYADSKDLYFVTLPKALEEHQQDALDADVQGFHVSLTLDEWTTFLRQTDIVETEAMVKDAVTGKIGRAIVRKSERQVNQNISWQVFRRDGFKCRYCGIDDTALTVDHLITWESGGPSTPANLVASCRKCNGARGETPFADWLYSPYYKRVSQNLDHAERFANQAVVATLGQIPITPLKDGKKRKRR